MRIIRVLFGYAVACLAAALTLVLFVYTPAELATLPSDIGSDRLLEAGFFALVIVPLVAAFAALPVLVAVTFAELRGIGRVVYYALAGIGIAALGFLVQHLTEAPGQLTILHNYALVAFLTAGGVAGLVYWLLSGRFAGHAKPGAAAPPAGPPASALPNSA